LHDRFEALNPGVRDGKPTVQMVDHFQRWAGQLGADPTENAEAGIAVYDLAIDLANADRAKQSELTGKRNDLRRGLAQKLATDWPFLAFHQLVELGDAEAM